MDMTSANNAGTDVYTKYQIKLVKLAFVYIFIAFPAMLETEVLKFCVLTVFRRHLFPIALCKNGEIFIDDVAKRS